MPRIVADEASTGTWWLLRSSSEDARLLSWDKRWMEQVLSRGEGGARLLEAGEAIVEARIDVCDGSAGPETAALLKGLNEFAFLRRTRIAVVARLRTALHLAHVQVDADPESIRVLLRLLRLLEILEHSPAPILQRLQLGLALRELLLERGERLAGVDELDVDFGTLRARVVDALLDTLDEHRHLAIEGVLHVEVVLAQRRARGLLLDGRLRVRVLRQGLLQLLLHLLGQLFLLRLEQPLQTFESRTSTILVPLAGHFHPNLQSGAEKLADCKLDTKIFTG